MHVQSILSYSFNLNVAISKRFYGVSKIHCSRVVVSCNKLQYVGSAECAGTVEFDWDINKTQTLTVDKNNRQAYR